MMRRTLYSLLVSVILGGWSILAWLVILMIVGAVLLKVFPELKGTPIFGPTMLVRASLALATLTAIAIFWTQFKHR